MGFSWIFHKSSISGVPWLWKPPSGSSGFLERNVSRRLTSILWTLLPRLFCAWTIDYYWLLLTMDRGGWGSDSKMARVVWTWSQSSFEAARPSELTIANGRSSRGKGDFREFSRLLAFSHKGLWLSTVCCWDRRKLQRQLCHWHVGIVPPGNNKVSLFPGSLDTAFARNFPENSFANQPINPRSKW